MLFSLDTMLSGAGRMVDNKINRKLVAILAANLAGYSWLLGVDG